MKEKKGTPRRSLWNYSLVSRDASELLWRFEEFKQSILQNLTLGAAIETGCHLHIQTNQCLGRNRRVTSWKETTERFVGLSACWHHSRTSTPPSRKLRDAVKTGSGSANENDVPGRERTVSVGMLRSARVDDGERNHHWPWLGKKVWSMGN